MTVIGHERIRTKLISMTEQKKEQGKSVENEAGDLKAGRGMSLGNPRPRQTSTVSRVPQAFTKLRHRVLSVPPIRYAPIIRGGD